MSLPTSAARWVPLAAGGVALAAYVSTAHPGLAGGDAGELAAAACAGGVAHPPGYPLYGLLLRLAAALPGGAVLWRMSLVSAVCGAGAVALLVDTVRRWAGRSDAGLVAGAAWLSTPLAWRYATSTEVFALHALLVCLVAWALTREAETPSRGWAVGVGLAAGLAVTHHPTALFVVAPLLAWRLVAGGRRGALVAGVVAGALPLALLVPWSHADTPFSWGDTGTPAGFVAHLLRTDYGTLRLAARDGEAGGLVSFPSAFLSFEGGVVWVPLLALAGVAWAWRRGGARAWLVAAGVALALALGVFGALVNLPLDEPLLRAVVSRFFLLPHLVLCAAAGLATGFVASRAVGVVLSAGLVVVGAVTHPRHDDGPLRAAARGLLAQPREALVLTRGDLAGGLTRALQACEGARPDLRVLDQELLTYGWYVARVGRAFPDLRFPGGKWNPAGGFTLRALLDANAGRPVVVCGGLKPGDPVSERLEPSGWCERLVPATAPFDETAWTTEVAVPAGDFEPGSWEAEVQREAWRARERRGLLALQLALSRGGDAAWLRRAYDELKACADGEARPPPALFKNLGIAAGRLGLDAEMRAALGRYVEVAPADDAELPTVKALLASP